MVLAVSRFIFPRPCAGRWSAYIDVPGVRAEVWSSFRQLIRELENRPLDIGEAAYRLPGLRMQVRTAVARPLLVDYAVCEDRRLVFIKGVKLLSR